MSYPEYTGILLQEFSFAPQIARFPVYAHSSADIHSATTADWTRRPGGPRPPRRTSLKINRAAWNKSLRRIFKSNLFFEPKAKKNKECKTSYCIALKKKNNKELDSLINTFSTCYQIDTKIKMALKFWWKMTLNLQNELFE